MPLEFLANIAPYEPLAPIARKQEEEAECLAVIAPIPAWLLLPENEETLMSLELPASIIERRLMVMELYGI